jgi:hypothetical protein
MREGGEDGYVQIVTTAGADMDEALMPNEQVDVMTVMQATSAPIPCHKLLQVHKRWETYVSCY